MGDKKKTWKDTLKKAVGTIIKVFLGGFTAVLLRILLEIEGLWPEIIALILLVWGAVVIGVSNVVEDALGSFTKTEAEAAKKGIDEAVIVAKVGSESTEMKGFTDEIEAKKKKISLEALKQEKYGDKKYDYGVSETEAKKKQEEIEAKQKELQKLQAELAIETNTTIPTPAPEVKPSG